MQQNARNSLSGPAPRFLLRRSIPFAKEAHPWREASALDRLEVLLNWGGTHHGAPGLCSGKCCARNVKRRIEDEADSIRMLANCAAGLPRIGVLVVRVGGRTTSPLRGRRQKVLPRGQARRGRRAPLLAAALRSTFPRMPGTDEPRTRAPLSAAFARVRGRSRQVLQGHAAGRRAAAPLLARS